MPKHRFGEHPNFEGNPSSRLGHHFGKSSPIFHPVTCVRDQAPARTASIQARGNSTRASGGTPWNITANQPSHVSLATPAGQALQLVRGSASSRHRSQQRLRAGRPGPGAEAPCAAIARGRAVERQQAAGAAVERFCVTKKEVAARGLLRSPGSGPFEELTFPLCNAEGPFSSSISLDVHEPRRFPRQRLHECIWLPSVLGSVVGWVYPRTRRPPTLLAH